MKTLMHLRLKISSCPDKLEVSCLVVPHHVRCFTGYITVLSLQNCSPIRNTLEFEAKHREDIEERALDVKESSCPLNEQFLVMSSLTSSCQIFKWIYYSFVILKG